MSLDKNNFSEQFDIPKNMTNNQDIPKPEPPEAVSTSSKSNGFEIPNKDINPPILMSSFKFTPVPIIPVVIFEIIIFLILIAASFTIESWCIREKECIISPYNIVQLIHLAVWLTCCFIDRFLHAAHYKNKMQGHLNFYYTTRWIRRSTFYVLSFGNAFMIILTILVTYNCSQDSNGAWQCFQAHISPLGLIQLFLLIESLFLIPAQILYIWYTRLFNQDQPNPDIDEEGLIDPQNIIKRIYEFDRYFNSNQLIYPKGTNITDNSINNINNINTNENNFLITNESVDDIRVLGRRTTNPPNFAQNRIIMELLEKQADAITALKAQNQHLVEKYECLQNMQQENNFTDFIPNYQRNPLISHH